ncbi:MAG: response regulator [Candidatus Hodarchaeota archaeon]
MPVSNNCELNYGFNPLKISTAVQSLMIVEDNPDLQQFYTFLFKTTPWRIISQISNCLIAKKCYTEIFPKPTIVLIDIELPGCSGFSVARYILRNNPVQKIVLISGKVDFMDDSSIPIDLCSIPRMSKPFHFNDLLNVLNRLASSN